MVKTYEDVPYDWGNQHPTSYDLRYRLGPRVLTKIAIYGHILSYTHWTFFFCFLRFSCGVEESFGIEGPKRLTHISCTEVSISEAMMCCRWLWIWALALPRLSCWCRPYWHLPMLCLGHCCLNFWRPLVALKLLGGCHCCGRSQCCEQFWRLRPPVSSSKSVSCWWPSMVHQPCCYWACWPFSNGQLWMAEGRRWRWRCWQVCLDPWLSCHWFHWVPGTTHSRTTGHWRG